MTLAHDDRLTSSIDWPNGEGFTPCTPEYAEQHDLVERLADELYGPDWRDGHFLPESEQDFEAYEAYHRALAKQDSMLASGVHVGQSVRY